MTFLTKPVTDWSVEEVGLFLHSIDLGHLEEQFRLNAVNGRDLLSYDVDDLVQGGLCTVIQGKKIKNTIATLPGGGGAAAAPPQAAAPVPVAAQPPPASIYQQPPAAYAQPPPMGVPVAVPTGPGPQQRAQASSLLGSAAQNLQQAIECVNSARSTATAMTGVNLLARRGPRNRSAMGTVANLAAKSAQNSRLEQADMFVTNACNSIMQAQQLVPQIPSIDIAAVQSLRGGVVRFIVAPTLSQASRMSAISQQAQRLQTTLTQVQSAQRWLQNMV